MAQGKITHEPPEHPIVHCVPLCPRWTAQSMVITACFNSRFRYNRGNTLPWTSQKLILSLHWDTHLTQGRQLLHEKVRLLTRPEIYRSLFALSSSREKMSLRSNSCSAVHLCLQAVCWALWNDTEETRGGWGGFPPNSCTWLTTWPQAWYFTSHGLLFPGQQNLLPPPDDLMDWLPASQCPVLKAMPHTPPACLPPLLSVPEVPDMRRSWWDWHKAHHKLLWPRGGEKSPLADLWERKGKVTSQGSSANRNPTRTHIHLTAW